VKARLLHRRFHKRRYELKAAPGNWSGFFDVERRVNRCCQRESCPYNRTVNNKHLAWLVLALPIVQMAGFAADGHASTPARWSWEEANATVDPKGDLTWKPRPFVFEKVDPVRYIDFEAGDDSNPGDISGKPWKHHPWDPKATGNPAAASGIRTYVFRRGSVYRGRLMIKEFGQPGAPIQITSDLAWGDGEAVLCGSERVTGWTKGAGHKDIPEPEKVWWADLDFVPRSVWSVSKDGRITRIPLARTPNWKVSNPDDVKSEWWVWDNPHKPFGNTIKDKPEDYFKGALIGPSTAGS